MQSFHETEVSQNDLTQGQILQVKISQCNVSIERMHFVMPDLQLRTLFQTFFKVHSLYLLLDISLNISTSHITGTLSTFDVIIQLMCYINYLLNYLFTYLLMSPVYFLSFSVTEYCTHICKDAILIEENIKPESI